MNKNNYKIMGATLALAAAFTACSNNDFESAPAINGNGMITAIAPQGGNVNTRTAYNQEGSDLKVTWNASGEDMYTINATADGWTAGQLKQVNGTSGSTSANFYAYDATASKRVSLNAGTLFAFYPQSSTIADKFTSLSSDGTSVSVPLTLDGQSGKLEDLQKYDYMTATSEVTEDNGAISVAPLQMKHEIAVLHINKGIQTLVENGTISKVVVSATGMKSASTMTITRNGSDITTSVTGTGSDASIAINNCNYTVSGNQLADDIYLAILPATMTNLTMKLTIGGNDFDYIYQGTNTNFEAGKIYNWSPTVDPGVMYFTIKTTASLKDFTIPFATSGTCPAQIVVNWGDGSSTTVNEGQSLNASTFKHSYSSYNTTYRITVNSAQKDVTKAQIPEFNFGKYPDNAIDSDDGQNKNGELLYSVDSKVLYSGATSLEDMFYGTDNLVKISKETLWAYPNVTSLNDVFGSYNEGKLSEIPEELFKYNTKVTDFAYAFYKQKQITTVPAGLFEYNTNATTFKNTFRNCENLKTLPEGLFAKNTNATSFYATFYSCTVLETLPKGLFAKNLKVTIFAHTFHNCYKLKLNKYIFISTDNEAQTRFKSVSTVIRFDNVFAQVGNNITDGNYGTCPDLWNYTYSSAGYGWKYDASTGNYTYPFVNANYWENNASSLGLGKGWAKAEAGDSNWHAQSTNAK